MARQIRNLIEMSKSQTKEFIASLSDRTNEANRKKMIKKAKATKFNLIL